MGGVADSSYALTFGNLPPTNDGTQTLIGSSGNIKAFGFTISAGQDYTLDNVILRLGGYDAGETTKTIPS
ncbi:choice-of-anchor R domain-containing protein [Anabaena sp. UHCC 0451]|uniref:choice-of-anchor R domain-containing protein n=1 Tax=Anabaena sp. UHCC 0451 TaxID=2055235 RepID=UPI002B1FC6FA|nr:choice-of-anchor R domain-containing protein [Anabaena sp. UHCC 0451]MEA5577730.1 choice-of-anchor R domain-containing protein [Anabaena sp. UHCC 0451]